VLVCSPRALRASITTGYAYGESASANLIWVRVDGLQSRRARPA
jgi:hypothetical protein